MKQKRFKLLINAYRRLVSGIQGYKFETKSISNFLLVQYRRPICGIAGV
ncbi:hypothetical protein [Robinsoniella sp. KNHs210]|nr:hypothetical protein [Robinsoniella sp. KNHs210]